MSEKAARAGARPIYVCPGAISRLPRRQRAFLPPSTTFLGTRPPRIPLATPAHACLLAAALALTPHSPLDCPRGRSSSRAAIRQPLTRLSGSTKPSRLLWLSTIFVSGLPVIPQDCHLHRKPS